MDKTGGSRYVQGMRRLFLLLLAVLPPLLPVRAWAELPTAILGLELGQRVERYAPLLDNATDARDRDALFLNEVDLREERFPTLRGGSLSYGNCADPGVVVGMKLKLRDDSQESFEKLLALYEKRFGKPDEYLGDAFRTVIAWKWRFRDQGQETQATLVWSRDPEMRPGISIKLRHRGLWEKEYQCHRARAGLTGAPPPSSLAPADMQRLIPGAP